ncbi:A/G-specific adenine glycosylase [Desulforhopalus sp. 52FAK]
MAVKFPTSDGKFFVQQLTQWFRKTKRDLPWRQSYDPYHVWISEIMLQQTQMDRGVRYFLRWIKQFPEVDDVASASEDEILSLWEGLGYYARARNLHKAAKEIVLSHSSVVPSDYETLLTLPGIGPYTAAAVASIAGNQDVAVIDANVNRIFARVLDMAEPVKSSGSQRVIRELADSLLPSGKARVFNQALMDFGGLVCTPKNPGCDRCSIQTICKAYLKGTVELRPVLKAPAKNILIHRLVALIVYDGNIYMQKRGRSAVWGGLWEFPGGEAVVGCKGETLVDLKSAVKKDTGLDIMKEHFVVQVQHQYTNHKITLDAYICELKGRGEPEPRLVSATEYRWMSPGELDGAACPSGIRKVIEYLKEKRPELLNNNIVLH